MLAIKLIPHSPTQLKMSLVPGLVGSKLNCFLPGDFPCPPQTWCPQALVTAQPISLNVTWKAKSHPRSLVETASLSAWAFCPAGAVAGGGAPDVQVQAFPGSCLDPSLGKDEGWGMCLASGVSEDVLHQENVWEQRKTTK